MLPRFAEESGTLYGSRDQCAFGIDSLMSREINEAVAGFVADRGGSLDGLAQNAYEWLQNPTVSEIFESVS